MTIKVLDREESDGIEGLLKEIDASGIKSLVEGSSGKVLAEDYFTSHFNPKYIFIDEEEGEYKAIGFVEEVTEGVYYLDKFFVDAKYQGNGIGTTLFGEIMSVTEGNIGLRACLKNTKGQAFYGRQERLLEVKTGEWIIYVGNGLDADGCQEVIHHALNKPTTLS